ncbi:MAG: FemAB family PEP-CTERM system-associated protein, partial [Gammaproteobacteria bacterium]|nr:FemAB family PEP-CTERM system-associated protein [Gammaproteobacteria bacterium]
MLNIPRKQRAVVRKGINAGLESEYDTDVDRFYESYAYSLHGLGTPAFPRKLFHILKEEFGDDCDILSIYKDGNLVSSVMNFYYKDEVLPYYAGASDLARVYKAHDFMYWELMRRSCERGLKWFDYGRSKVNTGPFSFKKNWGFEPKFFEYEYYLVKAKKIPNVSPSNPKYSMFINTWKKMPFWATKIVGPHINKYLG